MRSELPVVKKRPAVRGGQPARKQQKGATHEYCAPSQSILAQLIRMQLAKLSEAQLAALKRKLADLECFPIASVCSGSNVALVGTALLLKEVAPHSEVVNIFDCEVEPAKRAWLTETVHKLDWVKSNDCCVFEDIMELGDKAATCAVHGRKCLVKSGREGPILLDAGVSCKSLSRMNLHYKSMQNCAVNSASKGSTGDTLTGLIDYMTYHDPPFVVMENLVELLAELPTLRALMAPMGVCVSKAGIPATT